MAGDPKNVNPVLHPLLYLTNRHLVPLSGTRCLFLPAFFGAGMAQLLRNLVFLLAKKPV